jgi:hypothetical protein
MGEQEDMIPDNFKSSGLIFSLICVLLTFISLWADAIPKEHVGNAFLFLTAVATLQGGRKVVEHSKWNNNETS